MQSAAVRRVAKELRTLMEAPLEGVRVEGNEADLSELAAVLDGPVDTPFEGGRFRLKLRFGPDFPAAPPKGFFVTKIFHPNVAPATGEICVNTLKRDWKDSYGVAHILLTIKCLLMVPNAESSLNEEAGKLLLERYDDYFARARAMTRIHAMSEAKDNEPGEKTLSEIAPNQPATRGKAANAQIAPPNKTRSANKRGLKRL